jgi:hypothetical protein
MLSDFADSFDARKCDTEKFNLYKLQYLHLAQLIRNGAYQMISLGMNIQMLLSIKMESGNIM